MCLTRKVSEEDVVLLLLKFKKVRIAKLIAAFRHLLHNEKDNMNLVKIVNRLCKFKRSRLKSDEEAHHYSVVLTEQALANHQLKVAARANATALEMALSSPRPRLARAAPAPAPAPAASNSHNDEVEFTMARSWAERDAALRKKAILLPDDDGEEEQEHFPTIPRCVAIAPAASNSHNDEVEFTMARSWAERDAALRKKAVLLPDDDGEEEQEHFPTIPRCVAML